MGRTITSQASYKRVLETVRQLSIEERRRLIDDIINDITGYGMWEEKEEMADPVAYVKKIRKEGMRSKDDTVKSPEEVFNDLQEWKPEK